VSDSPQMGSPERSAVCHPDLCDGHKEVRSRLLSFETIDQQHTQLNVPQCKTQEEEAEEDGEAERMAEWNRGAADAAYKLEIEKAQQQQLLLDQEAAAWVRTLHPISHILGDVRLP